MTDDKQIQTFLQNIIPRTEYVKVTDSLSTEIYTMYGYDPKQLRTDHDDSCLYLSIGERKPVYIQYSFTELTEMVKDGSIKLYSMKEHNYES